MQPVSEQVSQPIARIECCVSPHQVENPSRPNRWLGFSFDAGSGAIAAFKTAASAEGMMKTVFLSTLILALSTSAGFAQQPAQCRNFEVTIALQMTKEGCLSQIDLCTVGTVMSNEPALAKRRNVGFHGARNGRNGRTAFVAQNTAILRGNGGSHGKRGNIHDYHCWHVRHRVAGLQPTG